MKVLFLSLYTFKSINDGYIYADLIKQFLNEGHKLTVISPDETISEDIISVDESLINIRIKNGPIQKTSPLKKLINLWRLDKKSISVLRKETDKFDLVICMISHCAFFRTVKYIKDRDKVFIYNMVKDIFPQNAVDLGMMKKGGLLYKWFKAKESRYYKISDCLGVLSDKAVQFLRKDNQKLKDKALEVNPNSCICKQSQSLLSQAEKIDVFNKYNLPLDKTIFVYGGNLGKPQGIEFLLECVKINESREDGKAFFVIIGNGTEYSKIDKYFTENNIENSKLMPKISAKEFEELCSVCDVGLVFLSKFFTVPNYPSRVLSYMQARLPIIFAVDAVCDAGVIAQNNDYGFNCISGEADRFFEYVAELENNEPKRMAMGENAFKYMAENYSVKNSYDIIMKHLGG